MAEEKDSVLPYATLGRTERQRSPLQHLHWWGFLIALCSFLMLVALERTGLLSGPTGKAAILTVLAFGATVAGVSAVAGCRAHDRVIGSNLNQAFGCLFGFLNLLLFVFFAGCLITGVANLIR